jgi:agmatine deiminase
MEPSPAKPASATPFSLGYKTPAEWQEHSSTWLAWPKNRNTFIDETLEKVEEAYLKILSALSKSEPINLLVDDKRQKSRVADLIKSADADLDSITMHEVVTGDVWIRDSGPIFITRTVDGKKEVAYTHWDFNVWGGKYDDIKPDATLIDRLPLGKYAEFKPHMVLEGGSVDTNGLGTFITTEQCLLGNNRNPGFSKQQIEGKLKDYLGATNMVWLKKGIQGDDTDGHIDDLARFVSEDTVVCAAEKNKEDENYKPLLMNYDTLTKAKDQQGNALKVVQFPMPERVEYKGARLPASYTNFYIANKVVLVPVFGCKQDREALGILKEFFRGRNVVGIDCNALVVGFGAIHCITQQQPSD